MELEVIRWKEKDPPTETELRRLYAQENLSPYAWSNGPGDTYAAHAHGYHKVLMVASGTITWIFPDSGQAIETFPGDRINLPAGVLHAARVGPQGVTCLEAHFSA